MDRELVLIDTGYGLRDAHEPRASREADVGDDGPELREEMTAVRQIERLGFRVGHVVLSPRPRPCRRANDFPEAPVHLLAEESRGGRSPPHADRPHALSAAAVEHHVLTARPVCAPIRR
jgi:hypothetical protein